jgi:hypothetical protein
MIIQRAALYPVSVLPLGTPSYVFAVGLLLSLRIQYQYLLITATAANADDTNSRAPISHKPHHQTQKAEHAISTIVFS